MIRFTIEAETPAQFAEKLLGVTAGLLPQPDPEAEKPVEYVRPSAEELQEVSRSPDQGALKQLWDLLGAEHQTAAVLRVNALLEVEGRAVPFKGRRKKAEAAPAASETAGQSASDSTPSASESSQVNSSPAENKQPESAPAEQPQAPAPEATPASDSAPVGTLEAVRALLSAKIKEGKQPAVNALVTSFAPALSKVPAEKLADLAKLAEAL